MQNYIITCDKCGRETHGDNLALRISVNNGMLTLNKGLFNYWRDAEVRADLCRKCLHEMGFSIANKQATDAPTIQNYTPETVNLIESLINFLQSVQPNS